MVFIPPKKGISRIQKHLRLMLHLQLLNALGFPKTDCSTRIYKPKADHQVLPVVVLASPGCCPADTGRFRKYGCRLIGLASEPHAAAATDRVCLAAGRAGWREIRWFASIKLIRKQENATLNGFGEQYIPIYCLWSFGLLSG